MSNANTPLLIESLARGDTKLQQIVVALLRLRDDELAAGPTIEEIAALAGVGERAVRRWLPRLVWAGLIDRPRHQSGRPGLTIIDRQGLLGLSVLLANR